MFVSTVIPAKHVVADHFSFGDFEREADAIVEQARREAEQWLARSRQKFSAECERLRAAASSEGRDVGYRAGVEQARKEAAQAALSNARAELDSLTHTLRDAAAGFDREKRRLLARAESGLIKLSLAIARRVCKLAAGASSDVALANARHVLEMVGGECDVELRVHPLDEQSMRTACAELHELFSTLEHVSITGDAALERGDCVLRAGNVSVDASLDVQLDRIAEALLPQ